MGLRGELFSTRVLLQNRTYFFNVKENRMGDLYLNIVESKNRDEGGFDRQSVILFADDLQEFLKGFDESLRVMEKEVRQRRHSSRPSADDGKSNTKSDTKSNTRNNSRGAAGGDRGGPAGERFTKGEFKRKPGTDSRKGDSTERPRRNRAPEEGKRVVVRKRRD